MGGISQAVRQDILEYMMGGNEWSQPSYMCVSLHVTTNTSTSPGTEVTTGTGYTRMTFGAWSSATAADPSVVANSAAITWATATGAWGTIISLGLYDTITGGTYYGYVSLATHKTIAANDVARIAASQCSISLNET